MNQSVAARPARRTVETVTGDPGPAAGHVAPAIPAPFPYVNDPGDQTNPGAHQEELRSAGSSHFVLDDTTCWLRLCDTHPALWDLANQAPGEPASTPELITRDEMLALQLAFGSQVLSPRIVEATSDLLAESFSPPVLSAIRTASDEHSACRCGRPHLHTWLARAELTAHAHIKNAGSSYLLHVHPLTTTAAEDPSYSITTPTAGPGTDSTGTHSTRMLSTGRVGAGPWDASMASAGGHVIGHIASQPPASLVAPLQAVALHLTDRRVSWAFYLHNTWVYQHIDIENRPARVELLRSQYPTIDQASFVLVNSFEDTIVAELLALRRHHLTLSAQTARRADAEDTEPTPVSMVPLAVLAEICDDLFSTLPPALRQRIPHLAPQLPGYDLAALAAALGASSDQ